MTSLTLIRQISLASVSALATLVTLTPMSHAAGLVGYDFGTGSGTQDPTTLDSGVSATQFTHTPADSSDNFPNGVTGKAFRTKDWTTSTSPDLSEFLSFTVTPNAGYKMTLTSLSFAAAGNGNGARPQDVQVRSSLDNFTASLLTHTNLSQYPNFETLTALLPQPDFADLMSSVTFRIYPYNATNGNGGDFRIDDVTLSGTTSREPNAVPEPFTILGSIVATGMGASMARKRKLQNKFQKNAV